jgi:hypothetical protein
MIKLDLSIAYSNFFQLIIAKQLATTPRTAAERGSPFA